MSDARNNAWRGSQDSGSAVHPYNTEDFHIHAAISRIRTALPVQVVRAPYDPATGNDITPGTVGKIGVVDVQILVNQLDGFGNATPHGVVYGRPYHRCQSALGAIIADPVKGDIGELVVHDRDTSIVESTGAQGNPGSRRKHSFEDGVYHGQQISSATPTQYITFTSSGLKIADKHGNSLEMANNLITVKVGTATYTFDNNGNFKASGNVVAGQGGSDQVDLQQHTHGGGTIGSGTTGPPTPGS